MAPMQKHLTKLAWLGVFLFAISIGAFIFMSFSQKGLNGTEVDWRLLGEMDYITGKTPAQLKALDSKNVKIPGFMVPLEDSQRAVTEFLLVPSPQACIHVPAPPPNQMVYVKMETSQKSEVAYGPIWVYGKLNLVTKKSIYGEASFELIGEAIEPYK